MACAAEPAVGVDGDEECVYRSMRAPSAHAFAAAEQKVECLQDVELPRTIDQLRQAADAAREGSWCNPVIDTASGIRAMLSPIGPVCVFGPNNFPFAFNGAAGGDFAAAVAAGNPVIAKGHSSHPRTTQIFAEEAFEAARETGMPKAMIRELRLPKPAPLLRAPV